MIQSDTSNPIVDAQGFGGPMRRVGLADRMSGSWAGFFVVSAKADGNRAKFSLFVLFGTRFVFATDAVASRLIVTVDQIDGHQAGRQRKQNDDQSDVERPKDQSDTLVFVRSVRTILSVVTPQISAQTGAQSRTACPANHLAGVANRLAGGVGHRFAGHIFVDRQPRDRHGYLFRLNSLQRGHDQ